MDVEVSGYWKTLRRSKLRQDAGSLVPMPIGVMRNVHFPSRTADYVTLAEKKDLKRNNIVPQRDFSFGATSRTDGAEIKEMGQSTISQPGRGSRGRDAVHVELDQLQVSVKSDRPAKPYTLTSYSLARH